MSLADIVYEYFGKSGTYGVLEVRATYPVMVTSNTYNVAGSTPGTFGQYPGLSPIATRSDSTTRSSATCT